MNIILSKQELKNLLLQSFQDGYEGYLDNKEDCVDCLLESFLKEKDEKNKKISSSSYSISNATGTEYLSGFSNVITTTSIPANYIDLNITY